MESKNHKSETESDEKIFEKTQKISKKGNLGRSIPDDFGAFWNPFSISWAPKTHPSSRLEDNLTVVKQKNVQMNIT